MTSTTNPRLPLLVLTPRGEPSAATAALAGLIPAEIVTPGEFAAKPRGGTLLVLDPLDLPRGAAPSSVIVCVPPEAGLGAMDALDARKRPPRARRLVTFTPMHHLYAIERLKWPAERVELIPDGIDPTPFAGARGPRDASLVVELDFEGADRGLCERAGLPREAKVRVVPPSSPEELAKALAPAGVVVVAAARRESGAGTQALLAAMASGAPIVASRTWGLEHLLVDDMEGLLFEPGDVAGARAAARQLLSDPTEAARMGARAAAKVDRCLTLEHLAARLRRIALAPPDAPSPEFHLIAAHGRTPSGEAR